MDVKIARLQAKRVQEGVCERIENGNRVSLDTWIRIQTPRWLNQGQGKMSSVCTGEPGMGCARRYQLGFSKGRCRRGGISCRNTHPSSGNGVVIVTIFAIPRRSVGTALARWEHDPRPRRNILTEFAAATHVHLKHHHTKEITVLAGLTLSRHRWYLGVERVVLIAILRSNNVEVVASVASATRTAVGLHLNRDSASTVRLGLIVRMIVVDAHLGWGDRSGVQITSQGRRWRLLHRWWTAVIGHFGGDGEQRPSEEILWLDGGCGEG